MDEVLLPVLDGDGDLVILDLELPDAGKARAVEVLRRASSSLVLVVISSDEDLDRGREVLRHGVFYYGIKPVPEAELLAGVDQALVYCAGRRAGIG
jgi:DNA-binding NarL/FixJ family response regulator